MQSADKFRIFLPIIYPQNGQFLADVTKKLKKKEETKTNNRQ